METAIEEQEIIYVGDPMCSWCWGVAPELDELRQRHPELGFRVVVGGLRPGPGAEPMTDALAATLTHHWRQVAGRSGQSFDHRLLERRDWLYDTEPACKAVVTMRELEPELAWPLFQRLQRAFYAEGTLLDGVDVLSTIVEEVGGDGDAFSAVFATGAATKATWGDFALARSWGVTGFPTVIARQGNRGSVVAAGYATADDMDMALSAAMTPTGDACAPGQPC